MIAYIVLVTISLIVGMYISLTDKTLNRKNRLIAFGTLILVSLMVVAMVMAKTFFIQASVDFATVVVLTVLSIYLIHQKENNE